MTFENEEPAEKVCSIQYHDIKGKKVEVKVAQTKEAIAMQQGRGRMIPQRNYSEYQAMLCGDTPTLGPWGHTHTGSMWVHSHVILTDCVHRNHVEELC